MLSDADFPAELGWRKVDEGQALNADDGIADALLVRGVLALADVNQDGQSSPAEVGAYLTSQPGQSMRAAMRHWIVKHPSEWDSRTLEQRYQRERAPGGALNDESAWRQFREHAEKLCFQDQGGFNPVPLWHFHPLDAPGSLQEITSPAFDPLHKIVYSSWRGGAALHGIDTYQWKNGNLVEVDSRESHFLPVRRGEKYALVYVTPTYAGGQIEDSPLLLKTTGGKLQISPSDTESSLIGEFSKELDYMDSRLRVDVWQRGPAGSLRQVQSNELRWQTTNTPLGKRWCPSVPYFDLDNGQVGRQIMGADCGELCSEVRPKMATEIP